MTVEDFLQTATKQLVEAGIETARLDTLVLMEDVLHVDRALLLAHPERHIPESQVAILNNFVTQRIKHLPLAYIRGKAPFFGRYFAVDTHVLVPRSESEDMIEMLLDIDLSDRPRIADVGTGSGCLGITAALEIPDADVYLYDIDPAALEVARHNADVLGAKVHFSQQDLLEGSNAFSFEAVLANLPYVPDAYPINAAARHEPALALFSGRDGMDCYRLFWQQISRRKSPPAHVLTESLTEQHGLMAALAERAGYALTEDRRLIQHFARHLG